MAKSEHLLETLLDLERARQRESELRIESEVLLDGLHSITEAQDTESLFQALIEILRTIVDFQHAFILKMQADQTMLPIASTKKSLLQTIWQPGDLFKRVLSGRPAAVFDIEQVSEWAALPASIRSDIKSALHISVQNRETDVILICTHAEPKHFNPGDIKQLQRFAPLASQALTTLDLQRAFTERDRFFGLSLELMAIVNIDGNFIQLNNAWQKILGYPKETFKERSLFSFVRSRDRKHMLAVIQQSDLDREPRVDQYRFRCHNGKTRWLSCSMIRFQDENLYYIAARDVTDQVLAEEKLFQDARHDALTGLFNRALFMERLEQAIDHANRQSYFEFAVLYLDLDRFKLINDSLGHLAGDDLLVEVSNRLSHAIRNTDTVARLGGDEFIILLVDMKNPPDAGRMAQRLLASISEPMMVRGSKVSISASIGITFSSLKYDNNVDVLRDADIAMYAAKNAGKSQYMVFDQVMHEKAVTQLEMEIDLRHAINENEFTLHFQPIIDINSGHIVSIEALIRWHHPKKGFVSPLDFISVAEENGLIVPIGQWVFEEACKAIKQFQEQLSDQNALSIHINISARQFWHNDFIDNIVAFCKKIELETKNVILEVTESVIINSANDAAEIFQSIKAQGFLLYIDDFGTGFSSLSYLHQFPFDGLKIDRSFVNQMGKSDKCDKLVNTIVVLAKNFDIDLVAEGVETSDQAERLRQMGCNFAQGFLYSKPIPMPEIIDLLND